MAQERLQKFLSECSVASRRKSEELIKAGKVKVNGRVAQIGDKIDTKKDTVTVNGKKVNIPSYLVKAGDVIAVCDKSRSLAKFKDVAEANSSRPVAKWLDFNKTTFEAKVMNLPDRADIDFPVEEHLIVELYSK